MIELLNEIHPGEILQTEYDMRMAARTLQEKIAPRIRVYRAAA